MGSGGEEKKDAYVLLVGKSKGKRSLRRPRYGWMDNVVSNGVFWGRIGASVGLW
jgi:hypothetical protein